MSLSMADAVSIEPAPTPTTVTSSDKSVLNVITFNVPFTANGEPCLTSIGATVRFPSFASATSLIRYPSLSAN